MRASHNCWVVAKRVASRTIAVVLEGRGEESLLDADKAAEQYINTHFAGLLA